MISPVSVAAIIWFPSIIISIAVIPPKETPTLLLYNLFYWLPNLYNNIFPSNVPITPNMFPFKFPTYYFKYESSLNANLLNSNNTMQLGKLFIAIFLITSLFL